MFGKMPNEARKMRALPKHAAPTLQLLPEIFERSALLMHRCAKMFATRCREEVAPATARQ